MTSSWFFLSTLNYDARSTTHQINFILPCLATGFNSPIGTVYKQCPHLKKIWPIRPKRRALQMREGQEAAGPALLCNLEQNWDLRAMTNLVNSDTSANEGNSFRNHIR